ncbi:dihydropteroate synthase [Qiania dongpingensis]|uniref:Dihydropteroate synthase n=1 Tax=Qiania dongpingensis TaxID=2763669 RepID=A0A7G9G2Z9_9FIRM|nr:dihydropteroate synthase [Qiania dongpingensis]QNM05181.1 dihydropteroate synthase [Qiania dongpingensis]
MKIGDREFEIGKHTYIMGILNVTPDSFSDGGKWNRLDAALKHAEDMLSEGADIIDIGGESTRPGYGEVLPDEEEMERVLPVIEAVKERFETPISIDTYKSGVAEAAVKAGAHLINDIWGCRYDEKMAGVIAKYGVCCCLMHNRKEPVYENYLEEVADDLKKSAAIAKKAGVADDKIILDPGIGFGKTYEHNLRLMNHLEILAGLGYPVLLGTSRKSMIGLTLDLPAAERLEGTLATTVMGVMKGCAFVRVHDVKSNKRAVLMTEAILNAK